MAFIEDTPEGLDMLFTLKDGSTTFEFPVNPEEVSISRSKGYETINMLEHGEFDFAIGEKVKEITFSSFFPKEHNRSFCQTTTVPDPRVAMNVLNTFLVSKKPLRFIISNTGVNVPVYLVTLNTTFRGGEPGDIYFDLTLRTWRDSKVEKLGAGRASKSSSSRTDLKKTAKRIPSNPVTRYRKSPSWSWEAVQSGTRSTSSTKKRSATILTESSLGKSWCCHDVQSHCRRQIRCHQAGRDDYA